LVFGKFFSTHISKLISSMSHQAATDAETKKDHYRSLTTNDEGSVSSVSREKSEATVANICYLIRASIQIL